MLFRPYYDFSQYERIRNKWNQYCLLKKHFRRDCIHLSPDIDNRGEFESFIKAHPLFVVKPVRAFHGDNVRVINTDSFQTDDLYESLNQVDCVCDELILQDSFFMRFHPQSVNTVRILAIRKVDRTVILHPQLHLGRGNSVADNDLSSIRANIDVNSGVVYTPGYDHYMEQFILHPDTGEKIVGREIPKWDQLISDIHVIMGELDGIAGYIGFDMALTKNSWCIVEINPFPQFYSQQLVDKTGYRKEIEKIVTT